jgi:hypothetical protein
VDNNNNNSSSNKAKKKKKSNTPSSTFHRRDQFNKRLTSGIRRPPAVWIQEGQMLAHANMPSPWKKHPESVVDKVLKRAEISKVRGCPMCNATGSPPPP